MSDRPGPSERDPDASLLFARYLSGLEDGGSADFEGLCAAHPTRAPELRILLRDWQKLAEVFSHLGLGPGASIAQPVDDRDVSSLPLDLADVDEQGLRRLARRSHSFQRYELGAQLGKGGQGIVLRARDRDLKRNLAMKLIRLEPTDGGSPQVDRAKKLGRFLEEAQITGRLDHPGIVPVHELGLDQAGRVYFTMQLVDGRDLRTIFELVQRGEEGWTTTRALNVLLRVCDAMAYAHSKGIVHRDLKPSNIMVGPFEEVYVMDWGLARVLGDEDKCDLRFRKSSGSADRSDGGRGADDETDPSPLMTMDGDVLGTPAYMPPEQACGRLDEIGPHSDVYSLGAMLYELLGGRAPYGAGTRRPHAVLEDVQKRSPERLDRVDGGIARELVAICGKCMERTPRRRYQDMAMVGRDLRAFLEGRVVQAYERGTWAEVRKWARRNSGLATAIFASIVLAVGWPTTSAIQAAKSRERAERDERDRYRSQVPFAKLRLEQGAVPEAILLLRACGKDLRSWEWHYLWTQCSLSMQDLELSGIVADISVDPDARTFASVEAGGVVRMWDHETGAPLGNLPVLGDAISVLTFGPEPGLLSTAANRSVQVWNTRSMSLVRSFSFESPVTALTSGPGDGTLYVGCEDGSVNRWASGEASRVIEPMAFNQVDSLVYMKGPRLIVAGRYSNVAIASTRPGDDRNVVIYDAVGKFVAAGEDFLAAASLDRSRVHVIHLTDVLERPGPLPSRTVGIRTIPAPIAEVAVLEGRTVAVGDTFGRIHLFDAHSISEEKRSFSAHEGPVRALAALDENRLVSGSTDARIRVWDQGTREGGVRVQLARYPFLSIVSTSDDELVLLSNGGVLSRFDLVDGTTTYLSASTTPLELPSGNQTSATPDRVLACAALAHDTSQMAFGTSSGTVKLIDGASGELIRECQPGTGRIEALAYHPTRDRLVGGDENGSLYIWDVSTGDLIEQWDLPESKASALCVRADGAAVLVGTESGRVYTFDSESAAFMSVWKAHERQPISALVGSPNGNRIATCAGGLVRLWDVAFALDGLPLLDLKADGAVRDITFAVDGRRLLAATDDGVIQIWDIEPEALRALWDLADRVAPESNFRSVPSESASFLVNQLLASHSYSRESVVRQLLSDETIDASVQFEAVALARSVSDAHIARQAFQVVADPHRDQRSYAEVERFARSVESDRRSALIDAVLGGALYRQGRAADALEPIGRAVVLAPDAETRSCAALFGALCHAQLGDVAQASSSRELALRDVADPSFDVRLLLDELDLSMAAIEGD